MYSVIIPTMWKCDRLRVTLNQLRSLDCVGEIILIDNTDNNIWVELPKVNHIKEGKNTYVNPAWNKGYHLSQFDKLLILNDDIWMKDWKSLEQIDLMDIYELGIIGMDIDGLNGNTKNSGLDRVIHREGGWGCMMIMDKRNYIPIPEEMLIWGGDDYLFVRNREKWGANHKLIGIELEGLVSLTADSSDDFNPIKQNDLQLKHKYKLW